MKIRLKGNKAKAARWIPYAKLQLQKLHQRPQPFLQWRQKLKGNVIVHVKKFAFDEIFIQAGGDAIFAGGVREALNHVHYYLYYFPANRLAFLFEADNPWEGNADVHPYIEVERNRNRLNIRELTTIDTTFDRRRFTKDENSVYQTTDSTNDYYDRITTEAPPPGFSPVYNVIRLLENPYYFYREYIDQTHQYELALYNADLEGVSYQVYGIVRRLKDKNNFSPEFMVELSRAVPGGFNAGIPFFIDDALTFGFQMPRPPITVVDTKVYFTGYSRTLIDSVPGQYEVYDNTINIWSYDYVEDSPQLLRQISQFEQRVNITTPEPSYTRQYEEVELYLQDDGTGMVGYVTRTVSFNDPTATPVNEMKFWLGGTIEDAVLAFTLDTKEFSVDPAAITESMWGFSVLAFWVLRGGLDGFGNVDFDATEIGIITTRGVEIQPGPVFIQNRLPACMLRWSQADGFTTVLLNDPLDPDLDGPSTGFFGQVAVINDAVFVEQSGLYYPGTQGISNIALSMYGTWNAETRTNGSLNYLPDASGAESVPPSVFPDVANPHLEFPSVYRDDR